MDHFLDIVLEYHDRRGIPWPIWDFADNGVPAAQNFFRPEWKKRTVLLKSSNCNYGRASFPNEVVNALAAWSNDGSAPIDPMFLRRLRGAGILKQPNFGSN
jgi:hypothetical protein